MILAFSLPYNGHNAPAIAALACGILLLLLMLKAVNLTMRLALFAFAALLFVGAYWWYTHVWS